MVRHGSVISVGVSSKKTRRRNAIFTTKLSGKEKVLQYILSKDIGTDNKTFIGTNSYKSIEGIEPKDFIKYLSQLEADKLISLYFCGKRRPSSACYVTIIASTYDYFKDRKKKEKENFWKPIKITVRDIFLLAFGAIFGGIVSLIIALFV